jgi:hypothetical protein
MSSAYNFIFSNTESVAVSSLPANMQPGGDPGVGLFDANAPTPGTNGAPLVRVPGKGLWMVINGFWQQIAPAPDTGGGTLPPGSVGQAQLQPASVGTDQLIDGSVTLAKLDPALALPADSVGTPQLQDGSVTAEKLAGGFTLPANSVGTPELIAASVTQDKLALLSVGGPQLILASVGQPQMGLLSVGTPQLILASVGQEQLALLSVGTPQLIDASVTAEKLAPGVFSNPVAGLQVAQATYDFSVDGGAEGTITPATNAVIPANAIVMNQVIDWTTPAAGNNNVTAIGLTGQDAALLDPTERVNLTGIIPGNVQFQTSSTWLKLAADSSITLTVTQAPLTAGVCNIWVFYLSVPA